MNSTDIEYVKNEIQELRQEMAQLREMLKPIMDAYTYGQFSFRIISALAQFTAALASSAGLFYLIYNYFHNHG